MSIDYCSECHRPIFWMSMQSYQHDRSCSLHPANEVPALVCRQLGHDWFADDQLPPTVICLRCGHTKPSTAAPAAENPEREKGADPMFGIHEGDLITNGDGNATVKAVTDLYVIAAFDGGTEFVITTSDPAWSVATAEREVPTLVIERPHVVYRIDGTRVDGYKFRSRALRNNLARCAGEGFFIATLDPSQFEFISA